MKIQQIKIYIYLVTLLFICHIGNAQSDITKEEWQSDLRYLQDLVHKDYPFLFKKVTSEKFDDEVEALHNAIPDMPSSVIPVEFSKIVALFEYGHTILPINLLAKDGLLPINLYQFSDGVYIEGAHKDYKSIVGGKLLAIEGIPIFEVLEKIRPVVPAENDSFFKAYGLRYALLPNVLLAQGIIESYKTDITLTLEKNGTTINEVVRVKPYEDYSVTYSFTDVNSDWISAKKEGEAPYYFKNLDKVYYHEYLPEYNAIYVRHSQIANDETMATKFFYQEVLKEAKAKNVDKFILDVRLNGGGNNYLNKPIITGIIKSHFNEKGKFFTIIGRRTFSACQNLINELSNYTNVIFVGEPSAENLNFYGDNRRVILPNSQLYMYLSFAWWQDKPQWENADWTIPHLAVELDFESYLNNEDPILEAALAYKDDDFILDPMAHLTELFTEGNMEQVKIDAKKISQDPRYQYSNFEEEFLKAGNRLMGSGDLQAQKSALFIFELVTELYPKSVSALYSLANTQAILKQNDNALVTYKRLIEVAPDNPLAVVAKARIKELED